VGAVNEWQCLLVCPDEATATPVVEYLNLHDCPALIFYVPPRCDFAPAVEVRVPPDFLRRARHIWTRAEALKDFTDGELEYLATGQLAGGTPNPQRQDDAA
jgi:hypothetical protein